MSLIWHVPNEAQKPNDIVDSHPKGIQYTTKLTQMSRIVAIFRLYRPHTALKT